MMKEAMVWRLYWKKAWSGRDQRLLGLTELFWSVGETSEGRTDGRRPSIMNWTKEYKDDKLC